MTPSSPNLTFAKIKDLPISGGTYFTLSLASPTSTTPSKQRLIHNRQCILKVSHVNKILSFALVKLALRTAFNQELVDATELLF